MNICKYIPSRYLNDSDYNTRFKLLFKNVCYLLGKTSVPALTSTYIMYGDGSNLGTGSNKLTWDNSTSDLLIRNGTDSAFRFYRHSGGANRISMYDGDGNELTLEAGSGYLFASNTDLIITNENDFGNPNLMIEPTSTGNETAFLISGYEGEVFKINKHGWVGIGVTPAAALDVVGEIKVTGIQEFANRTAAIAGGLTAGMLYSLPISSDNKVICII